MAKQKPDLPQGTVARLRVLRDRLRALLQSGRVAGGGLPYGWCSVPNPDGAGLVLAQDPEPDATDVHWNDKVTVTCGEPSPPASPA